MSDNRSEQSDIIPVLMHSTQIEIVTPPTTDPRVEIIPRQAESDEQLIELWLHGRPASTASVYRADAERMIKFVGKALAATTLRDLQAFADDLEQSGLAPASRHRTLSAIKSLFGFGSKLGYLCFDVGRALRLPTPDSRLAERILDEGQVRRMLMLEANPRNRMMLTVLYATGLRISELASLKWRDCVARQSGGQLTVMGKGNRIRAVLLPASVWCGLVTLRKGAEDEEPVFRSREGGHLHRSQLMRLVARAARRAGIAKSVSPHWLRHAHVSHALDNGCPVHVVAQTVGHTSLHSTTRYAHARPTESSSMYLNASRED